MVLVVAHFRKTLKPEIRSKLAWASSDDASLDEFVKRADQIEREGSSAGIEAISTGKNEMPEVEGQSDVNKDIW